MGTQQYDQIIIDIKNYVFHAPISSPKAWSNARIALLDAIGCAIETVSKSSDCKLIFGPIVPGSIIPNGFRLPGTSYVLDPVKGAFDLGTAIRYLDHNDAIAGADWGHPSDNLGAILATADWLNRSAESGVITHVGPAPTMNTILLALIKAYEIQGCMLLRNAFNAHGFDHVILVKLASTAVLAWMMGLSEEQTMEAVSHVWMDGHPLRVYRQKGNTIPRKGWAAGDACCKAVQLALLTRAGQPGSKTPLTMPRWGFYSASFGGSEFELPKKYGNWVIENIIFKVMPVEGHGLSSVEAAMVHLGTLSERNLSVEGDIRKIVIRTNAAADMIINKTGPLINAADRDHCLQYLVALTFLKGALPEAEDFLDSSPWSSSTSLDRLREKVDIVVDEKLTDEYMNLDIKSLAAGMRIKLRGGEWLDEVLIQFPIGHGKNEKTGDVVREKFYRNMGLMFSREEIEGVLKMVEDGGNEGKTVSGFLDLLVREDGVSSKL